MTAPPVLPSPARSRFVAVPVRSAFLFVTRGRSFRRASSDIAINCATISLIDAFPALDVLHLRGGGAARTVDGPLVPRPARRPPPSMLPNGSAAEDSPAPRPPAVRPQRRPGRARTNRSRPPRRAPPARPPTPTSRRAAPRAPVSPPAPGTTWPPESDIAASGRGRGRRGGRPPARRSAEPRRQGERRCPRRPASRAAPVTPSACEPRDPPPLPRRHAAYEPYDPRDAAGLRAPAAPSTAGRLRGRAMGVLTIVRSVSGAAASLVASPTAATISVCWCATAAPTRNGTQSTAPARAPATAATTTSPSSTEVPTSTCRREIGIGPTSRARRSSRRAAQGGTARRVHRRRGASHR